jgi:hypothetical protein
MLFQHVAMERDGSGTSWLPDESPIYADHRPLGDWMLMTHGGIFLGYANQDVARVGTRGETAFSAPNWFMAMLSGSAGEQGKVMIRGMFSLDRLTEGGNGYPLLFQTGEVWQGEPLIDRQHPHDLFAELAVAYSHTLGKEAALFGYLGYPGEPALGPPAFMHRPSSLNIADSPLSHHWQDATHITFGVFTAGLQLGILKVDGSIFTGREPDDNRYDFDRPRFDSYSGRLSLNPTQRLAMQISHGFLRSPEALEPETDISRTTASLLYHDRIAQDRYWTSSIIWGANKPEAHELQNSFLIESDFQYGGGSVFGRAELVQKELKELGIETAEEEVAWVKSITLGFSKDIATFGLLDLSAGVQGSLYGVEEILQPSYGTTPFSIELFIHVRPTLMVGSTHETHGM